MMLKIASRTVPVVYDLHSNSFAMRWERRSSRPIIRWCAIQHYQENALFGALAADGSAVGFFALRPPDIIRKRYAK